MKQTFRVVVIWCMALAGHGFAELYKVVVSREAQDLYHVEHTSRDIYVKTRFCYVYSYYEDAVIDTDRMVIHFLESEDECDIDKLLFE